MDSSLFLIALMSIGAVLGVAVSLAYYRFKVGSFHHIAATIIQEAESAAETQRKENELTLQRHALEHARELEKAWQNERKKMQQEEERLKQREDKLEARMNLMEKKLTDTEKREAILSKRKQEIEEQKQHLDQQRSLLIAELERVSGFTKEQAKESLIQKTAAEVRGDTARLISQMTADAQEEAEQRACRIIATAINRQAHIYVAEATVTTVALPNEEVKGRIIGREGRNIRALEVATGVSFIIDDTPGAVVLSGFDPIRRHVAKLALTELILDGRIHPSRIEEVVEKCARNVEKQIKHYGEDAAVRAGVAALHPDLITHLGKLKFRYSYGQNILEHSVEVSSILSIMATELKLNASLAKRIGLLHDIGKAITHEVDGPHALIGHNLAIKCGESVEVANGIGCHHNEMDPVTVEGSLCAAADTLSAGRPGVRIEAIGQYIKRLQNLEEIAYHFPGVEKAYALQAGREIRVNVLPDMIDDPGAINLAKDIAKKIEKDLTYPGRVKVTVIREKRVIEYAI